MILSRADAFDIRSGQRVMHANFNRLEKEESSVWGLMVAHRGFSDSGFELRF